MHKRIEKLMGIWYEKDSQEILSQENFPDRESITPLNCSPDTNSQQQNCQERVVDMYSGLSSDTSFFHSPDTLSRSITENWYNLWRRLS